MAEYVVKTNQLRSCASQLSGLQNQLDSVAFRLGAMQLGSVLRINASSALIGRVGDCKWAASNQSDNLGKLARAMEDIAELYERCERELSEPQTAEQAAQSNATSGYEDPHWLEVLEGWFPWLSGGISTGLDWLLDSACGIGRAIVDGVGNVVNWIGAGIGSFIDNYLEFDGQLTGEAIFEFLGQTVVDGLLGLGAGVLAGIAVPAAAAALGVTAPAWLPVAVGAVIVIGANALCTWITGDTISELVVDALWDAGEWIGDRVDDITTTISNGAQALWSGFTGLFS